MACLSCSVEAEALAAGEARPLLFMCSITAPPPPAATAVVRSSNGAVRISAASSSSAGAGPSAAGGSAGASLEAAPPSRHSLEVCCLEGCGLGWRVRPPLSCC